jgi:hypothetical protein
MERFFAVRFVSALSMCLVFACSLAAQPANILLIHGRGQRDRSTADLQREWFVAFTAGQSRLMGVKPDTSAIRFVSYQDLFRPDAGPRLCAQGEYGTSAIGEPLRIALRRLADAFSNIEGASTAVAEAFLEDTRDYLRVGAVRCAVNRRLLDALENGGDAARTLVIAHSMGGLVTLNALDAPAGAEPAFRVGSVITIGSQLRVPEIVEHLTSKYGRPYSAPIGFRRWIDIRGNQDAVSPGSPTGVWTVPYPERTFIEIKTEGPATHAARTYLENIEVAKRIRDEWCRLGGPSGKGCQ